MRFILDLPISTSLGKCTPTSNGKRTSSRISVALVRSDQLSISLASFDSDAGLFFNCLLNFCSGLLLPHFKKLTTTGMAKVEGSIPSSICAHKT